MYEIVEKSDTAPPATSSNCSSISSMPSCCAKARNSSDVLHAFAFSHSSGDISSSFIAGLLSWTERPPIGPSYAYTQLRAKLSLQVWHQRRDLDAAEDAGSHGQAGLLRRRRRQAGVPHGEVTLTATHNGVGRTVAHGGGLRAVPCLVAAAARCWDAWRIREGIGCGGRCGRFCRPLPAWPSRPAPQRPTAPTMRHNPWLPALAWPVRTGCGRINSTT